MKLILAFSLALLSATAFAEVECPNNTELSTTCVLNKKKIESVFADVRMPKSVLVCTGANSTKLAVEDQDGKSNIYNRAKKITRMGGTSYFVHDGGLYLTLNITTGTNPNIEAKDNANLHLGLNFEDDLAIAAYTCK